MEWEYTVPGEAFFDYCLYKYLPVQEPEGKFKSSNLLMNFFDVMNYGPQYYDLVATIRKKMGANKTVWGIKKKGDCFVCELYFYNWHKQAPGISISRFLEIASPFFDCNIKIDENLRYHMFSIDLLPEYFQQKKLKQIHLYIGHYGYLFEENSITAENYYSFHFPKTERSELVRNIKKSAFVDFSQIDLDAVIWPELVNCWKICRAYKKKNDGIYFSRITINQFLFFLERFHYPAPLISFIKTHRSRLDHMLYDTGFDYKMENQRLSLTKSGYYGSF